MGNSHTCGITIDLDQSNLFHFTNEMISGSVDVNISKEKLECLEVYLQLIGEAAFAVAEANKDQDDSSNLETRHRHEIFYSSKIPFERSEKEEEEEDKKKMLTLSNGKHSWPFQFQLPDHLPPSINSPEVYPHVAYYLEVAMKKSWYKPDVKRLQYITIYPQVDIFSDSKFLQATRFEKANQNDVIFEGVLDKTGYMPGGSMNITYSIENPKRHVIKSIEVSLVEIDQIHADSRLSEFSQTILPNISDCEEELVNETFSFTIPSILLPPSYQFSSDEEKKKSLVNVSYVIRFQINVKGLFNDFHFHIPFTLGTRSQSQFYRQLTHDSEKASSSSLSEKD